VKIFALSAANYLDWETQRVAKLKPGVGVSEAQTQLDTIAARLAR
jgi:hypothetical protein